MKFFYTPKSLKWLFLFVVSLAINYSCNKDNDMLEDSLLDPTTALTEEENPETEARLEETYLSEDDLPNMGFETRTAVFRPLIQTDSKITKDDSQNPDSPEKNPGFSYLRYDLSQIDSIGGTLDSAKLEFTRTSDEGDANVSVFKGSSDDWTEKSQPTDNVSEPVALLGELTGDFPSGQKQEIVLDKSQIIPEVLTLVIPTTESDNMKLVSKKDTNISNPDLVVTYYIPQGAKVLNVDKKNGQDLAGTSSDKNLQAVYAKASGGNRAPDSRPSASTVSGSAPLKVQFGKGKSSDDKGIASYKWYFMDGTTSTDPNPSHTFTEPGTYKVILSIKDQEGLENGRIIIIRVGASNSYNKRPDSRPSASIVSGKAPLKVQFGKGDSSDDKGIASYKWYFMDGTTATSPNPSHTFTKPGIYKVILSIKDQEGLENGRIIIITVTGGANKAPDARPDVSPASGKAPLRVQFGSSKSSDDTGIAGYKWDFMDGNKTTGASPVHTFSEPGTYKVVMTATDKDGLTNARIVVVTVTGNSSGGGSSSSGSGGSSSGSGSTGGSGNGNNTGGSNNIPSNAVKASTFGYNSSDATKALKAAINSSYSTIIVDKQAGDWIVGSLYLNRIRNKTIIFEKGVVLRAKRGAFRPSDRLFQLVNSDNVEIQGYGATFAMNKAEYSGQQNHALGIVNSSNITVKGLTLTGAGGDGIYVSRYNDGEYCRNIVIDGVTSTKNQRQGITVISVDGLQIKNSTFSETSGESPSAGIDFEPESAIDRLANITVTNCTFKDNDGPGIMFAVNKVNSNSPPIDATFRNIKVSNNSISNPRSNSTEIDLGTSSYYIRNPVKGTITFDGLTVENSRWSAIWTKKTLESYHVNIKNAVIRNVSKGSDQAAIHIGLLGYGNTANANMGGFTFENVLIDYDGVDPSLKLFGPGHGNWNLANLRGVIKVKSPRGAQVYDNKNKLETTSSSSVNLRIVEL